MNLHKDLFSKKHTGSNVIKVGIVIVNYFSTDLVMQCVDSINLAINNCDYAIAYKICVVDNSDSLDEFLKLNNNLSNKNMVMEIISGGGNYGFSRGTNAGILNVLPDVDFIHILNPDTVLDKNFYSALESVWSESSAISPVGTFLNEPSRYWSVGGKFYWMRARADVIQPKNNRIGEKYTTEFGTCANLIVSKKIIKEIGLLDEAFFLGGEEWDYSLRIRSAGYAIYVVPNAIYGHKVSGTHRKHGKMFLYIGLRTKLLFVSKWYGMTKIFWFLLFFPYVLFQYPFVFKTNVGRFAIKDAAKIVFHAITDHFRFKQICLQHIEKIESNFLK